MSSTVQALEPTQLSHHWSQQRTPVQCRTTQFQTFQSHRTGKCHFLGGTDGQTDLLQFSYPSRQRCTVNFARLTLLLTDEDGHRKSCVTPGLNNVTEDVVREDAHWTSSLTTSCLTIQWRISGKNNYSYLSFYFSLWCVIPLFLYLLSYLLKQLSELYMQVLSLYGYHKLFMS